MSKIDIAIKVTNDGAGEPFTVTGGEWVRNVIDIRTLLANLSGLDQEGRMARILSFTQEGCIITVARMLAGRGGDNVAAWIYVPATADVPGADVVDVVRQMETVISAASIDVERLPAICSREYPDRKPFSQAPTGRRLAYRRYDDVSLLRLLGPDRYQPYYDAYQYIYLLDMESSVDIRDGVDADDLTRQLVEPLSMIEPPTAEALRQHFRCDVDVTLADGRPFSSPVAVRQGGQLEIFFTREGFRPERCTVKKIDDKPLSPVKLSQLGAVTWKKLISRDDFVFVDEERRPLPADVRPTLRVNGKKLGADPIEMAEYDLRQVNVEASAKEHGYEPTAQFVNLSVTGPYEIQMRRSVRSWKGSIVMRNGEKADLVLNSKYTPNDKNGPLMGYAYERGDLVYDKSRVWAHRAQGLLAGLLLMGLCWGISAIVGSQKSKPASAIEQSDSPVVTDTIKTDTTKTPDPITTDGGTEYSLEKAVAYLDGNINWTRSDMEKNSYISGLFDAMNTFDLDELITLWKVQLKDSKRFQKVAEQAEAAMRKGTLLDKEPHTPTYNKPGDEVINVQNYINWIYNAVNPPAPKPAPVQGGGAVGKNRGKTTTPAGKTAGGKATGGQAAGGKKTDTGGKSTPATGSGNKKFTPGG